MSEMKKIYDGGPAFPQPDLSAYGLGPSERGEHGDNPDDFGSRHYTVEGMSLRDWFAGQALAGMTGVWLQQEREGFPPKEQVKGIHAIARYSYFIADAMIAARKAGAA